VWGKEYLKKDKGNVNRKETGTQGMKLWVVGDERHIRRKEWREKIKRKNRDKNFRRKDCVSLNVMQGNFCGSARLRGRSIRLFGQRAQTSKQASKQNASHIRSRNEVGSMFLGRVAGWRVCN
jgi:hypothetical protein